ncbi:MAG: outer membrane protein assembly factor BamB [Gammaproteobacteria bacterium]
MKSTKLICLGALTTLLSACNGFFDKDNTPTPSPLVNIKQEIQVQNTWTTSATNGVGKDYLKLVPAVTERMIYTASKNGTVTATDRATGKNAWSSDTKIAITGGPAANSNLVIVGGREGEVVALNALNGQPLWKTQVSSEILATPAISENSVLIKAIDGKVSALSLQTGQETWHHQQTEPTLILRGASAPQIAHNSAIIGYANGNLTRLTLRDGNLYWQEAVAIPQGSFAIQRMIDIDADPIILNHRIYAATYQGHIAALDFESGKNLWSYDISSYSGIAADHERVYVSDAKSHIWAFDTDSGRVNWRQNQLEARNTTGPAVLGNYIVVGDEDGYLHWLNKQDGHFVARVRVDSSGILTAPVVDNGTLYVVTRGGRLAAYRLG